MFKSIHTTCDFFDYLLFLCTHYLPQAIEVAILLVQMIHGEFHLIFFLYVILNILLSAQTSQFSGRTYHIFFYQHQKCSQIPNKRRNVLQMHSQFPSSFCPSFIPSFLFSPLPFIPISLSFLSSKITSCTGFSHNSPESDKIAR